MEFRKDVMKSRDEKMEEHLETIQKVIEDAAGEVAHSTKNERNIAKRTPESVRKREEAAARCTKVIKRRVLKKQARKARAEHLGKCILASGRRNIQRTSLSELVCQRRLHGRQRRMAKRTAKAL